jgi:hypothetical protein
MTFYLWELYRLLQRNNYKIKQFFSKANDEDNRGNFFCLFIVDYIFNTYKIHTGCY